MKTVFVALRTITTTSGAVIVHPIGVFSDKNDAIKAADECPRRMRGAIPAVMAAMEYVGLAGVGGSVMELPFTQGAGLVVPESGLILPANG